jgi:hypothetical protein
VNGIPAFVLGHNNLKLLIFGPVCRTLLLPPSPQLATDKHTPANQETSIHENNQVRTWLKAYKKEQILMMNLQNCVNTKIDRKKVLSSHHSIRLIKMEGGFGLCTSLVFLRTWGRVWYQPSRWTEWRVAAIDMKLLVYGCIYIEDPAVAVQ